MDCANTNSTNVAWYGCEGLLTPLISQLSPHVATSYVHILPRVSVVRSSEYLGMKSVTWRGVYARSTTWGSETGSRTGLKMWANRKLPTRYKEGNKSLRGANIGGPSARTGWKNEREHLDLPDPVTWSPTYVLTISRSKYHCARIWNSSDSSPNVKQPNVPISKDKAPLYGALDRFSQLLGTSSSDNQGYTFILSQTVAADAHWGPRTWQHIKEDALNITKLLESTLHPWQFPESQWPSCRKVALPSGTNYLYE